MSFKNKVVLVTGASSGIGAAIAIQFSKNSADLVLVGRNVQNLNKTALQCFKHSSLKPLCVIAELTKDEDVQRIISETKGAFSKLDVLVNSAGIFRGNAMEDAKIEMFDLNISVNLRPVINLSINALPLLIESKGNIVNISSIGAVKAIPGYAFSGIAKAGVDCFTKHMALEMAHKKVRANAITLGLVGETNIMTTAGLNSDDFIDDFLKRVPMGEVILPEEVAKLVMYMASDDARAMTGACVVFDGGYTIA